MSAWRADRARPGVSGMLGAHTAPAVKLQMNGPGSASMTPRGSGAPSDKGRLIGIGAAVARRPLPHHRAYGSVHGGSSRLTLTLVE